MGLSPMMAEYMKTKEKYKDCLLFYRLGDFYEMFFEDALTAARELELTLTGKACGLEERAPMCGIPHHAVAAYIPRLINKGYKVAICEQLEDPKKAKGIVKRGVVKIITPGTYTDSDSSENKNTYLMVVYEFEDRLALAFSDIGTGEFKVTSFDNIKAGLLSEIAKTAPKEIIVDENMTPSLLEEIKNNTAASITTEDFSTFNVTLEELKEQFSELEAGCLMPEREIVSRVLLKYINETQMMTLSNINLLEQYETVNYMSIDNNSRRNLELTESIRDKTRKGSLLWVLDKSVTNMGARLIKKWIDEPLIIKSEIDKRLDSVEEVYNSVSFNDDLRHALKEIYDIERIAGKISNQNANAKDLLSLKASLSKLPEIKELLKYAKTPLLAELYEELDVLDDIKTLIEKSIKEEPAMSIKEGNIIKEGYNAEVDEYRDLKKNGKKAISSLENTERELTGIKSLKVGYNKVFGYFIEVTKANLSMVPENRYIRKQTLTNAERFITEDLKNLENKILGSEEKLIDLEYNLFLEVRNEIEKNIPRIKKAARIVAVTDAVSTYALVAIENNYVKPSINTEGTITIKEGRHPVVEKVLGNGEFISNNTSLNHDDKEMLLITGPNMAGKSTYMRQVALITLMAQTGSFVPADSADISICDKIFTRIGASDDLAGGKSTFMVEMWEVSNILKNATRNSLVLLDEVGRGTSTYDGLSIAWSVIEYITKNSNLHCKTLFATHYHELVKLEGQIKGIKNYSVAVKKNNENVIFLRKIIEGGADRSYGLEVAKLAGLPEAVINRAKEILIELEQQNGSESSKGSRALFTDEVKENVCLDDAREINETEEKYQAEIKTLEETLKKQQLKDEEKYNNEKERFEREIEFYRNENSKMESRILKLKKELEESEKKAENTVSDKKSDACQMDFSSVEKESLINSLKNTEILNLNPMEAMNLLYKFVNEAKQCSK